MTTEAAVLDNRSLTRKRVWRADVTGLIVRLVAPVLFLAAGLAFYWEIVSPARILADYDVWTYFYPLRQYAAEAVRAGRIPLWNPDTFLGSPFFANPQTSLLYPGTLLFYVLPIPYAYSLSVIFHVLLAALLTYAFMCVTFGRGRPGALVGASAFAFGGFLSAQVGHINQLSASAWLPGIALAADLGLRRRSIRWTALAGLALATQLLAGHAQESYMTLWAVGVVLIWRAVVAWPNGDSQYVRSEGRDARFRRLFRVPMRVALAGAIGAALAVLGFGLAAIQLLPTLELSDQSIRAGGMTFAEASSFSLNPLTLVRSLLPGYGSNVFSEYIGYVGASTLAFAAVGVVLGAWRPMLCALALTQIAMFFALGSANPIYHRIFDVVPGLDLFRVPARWLFVYSFGAAGLAAVGADWALNRARIRPNPWRVAIFGLFVIGIGMAAMPFVATAPRPLETFWLMGLAAGLLVAFLAVRWPVTLVAAVVVLVPLAELRLAAIDLPQRHPVPSTAFDEPRAAVSYLQSTASQGHILSAAPTEYELGDYLEVERRFPNLDAAASFAFKSALKLSEVMSPNIPLRYGLSTVDGYDGGVLPLQRYLQIASLLVPSNEIRADGVLRTRLIAIPDNQLLRLFNVRAVIANEVTDVELGGFRFDLATARVLQPGETVRVDLPEPLDVQAIALLNSAAVDQGSQTDLGEMTLLRNDGATEELALTYGEDVFHQMGPGPLNAFQPTAGLNRGGVTDTATINRLVDDQAEPVTAIAWTWTGRGAWNLRAATILARDGSQHQLMLQPGLTKRTFSPVKVYERAIEPPDRLRLASRALIRDDEGALAALRSGLPEDSVVLAPETPSANEGVPNNLFRRVAANAEALIFDRVDGHGGGYLVVDDAWFPGWKARIDGVEAPVLRANVYFKGVWVPETAQRVELTYEPASLRIGAMVSVAALIVTAALLIRGRIWR
jgi:Bacterial membrane protein YfhO